MRYLFTVMALVLSASAAHAGAATVTGKDASGTTRIWDVVTDGGGNFIWEHAVCDGTNGANCAAVKGSGAAAAGTDAALVVSISPNSPAPVAGSLSNASSAVATSATNVGANSYLYGFNGTSWDQLQADNQKSLKVNCITGCTTGPADQGTFVGGTTPYNPIGGVFNDSIATLASGTAGAVRLTTDRNMFVNLNKIQGAVPSATNPIWVAGAQAASTTMQNAATSSISGTVMPVTGYGTALVNVQCTVTCSGGTTINFEGVDSFGTYFFIAAYPVNGGASVTSTQTTGQFFIPVNGLTNIRARISAYSAGTITVTGTPIYVAAPTAGNTSLTWSNSNRVIPWDGTTNVTVKPGSTAAAQADSALVERNPDTGTQADTACATSTGTCSEIALIKFANQQLSSIVTNTGSATPAGTNLIGKVQLGDGTNTAAIDACQTALKTNVAISQTASTQIVTGTAAKKTYFCSIFVLGADAENISLVEGTGTTCATNTAAVIGGTTAANGPNMVAGGGFTMGNGYGSVAIASNATADNVCLLQSGTGRVSGVVTYVQL